MPTEKLGDDLSSIIRGDNAGSLAESFKVKDTAQDNMVPNGVALDGRAMTFGEKLVGLQFNPSNDDKVGKAKVLCAALADLLHDDHKGDDATDLYDELYHHAIGEILNAQMNVVKVLTLKY